MNEQMPTPCCAGTLRIGDVAPNFQARTTQGELSLDQFRGQWVVFFSHPSDFTPVCTSEFVALARAASAFEKMNAVLLGLSVDSLYSHLAWLLAIRELFGVDVTFPVIEDPSAKIGQAYGMLAENADDTGTVRATYFIDPEGVIRAMTWYPLTVGRSVDEMLRMLAALQRTIAADVMTPEGWRPGGDLLMPPSQTAEHALTGGGSNGWFYRTQADK
jgi:peroxiredoxin (alkyl hydroperoxide reductase subunit C)